MALDPTKMMLKLGKTALLICDVQTKSSKVIFEFEKMVKNTSKLITACKLMDVPMIVTEQNPESLGHTVPEYDISGAKGLFPKMQSSMCIPEVNKALSRLNSGNKPESVMLVGIEAHLCVESTAIDLCTQGYQVHAVADCISSVNPDDNRLALDRMRQMGCVIGSMESTVVRMFEDSNHELFKKILHLVRPLPNTANGSKL